MEKLNTLITRRDFLKITAAGAAGIATLPILGCEIVQPPALETDLRQNINTIIDYLKQQKSTISNITERQPGQKSPQSFEAVSHSDFFTVDLKEEKMLKIIEFKYTESSNANQAIQAKNKGLLPIFEIQANYYKNYYGLAYQLEKVGHSNSATAVRRIILHDFNANGFKPYEFDYIKDESNVSQVGKINFGYNGADLNNDADLTEIEKINVQYFELTNEIISHIKDK